MCSLPSYTMVTMTILSPHSAYLLLNPCKHWGCRDSFINIYSPAAISCYSVVLLFFSTFIPFLIAINPYKHCICRDFFIRIWILLPSTVHAFTLPLSSSSFFRFLFILKPCKHWVYSCSSQSCCPSKTFILLFLFSLFLCFLFFFKAL